MPWPAPTLGSHCSRSHPNRFNFGGVITCTIKATDWNVCLSPSSFSDTHPCFFHFSFWVTLPVIAQLKDYWKSDALNTQYLIGTERFGARQSLTPRCLQFSLYAVITSSVRDRRLPIRLQNISRRCLYARDDY